MHEKIHLIFFFVTFDSFNYVMSRYILNFFSLLIKLISYFSALILTLDSHNTTKISLASSFCVSFYVHKMKKKSLKNFSPNFPVFFLIIITSFYFRDQNSTNVYMWKFSLGDRGEIFLCVQIIIKKEWKWSKTYIYNTWVRVVKKKQERKWYTHIRKESDPLIENRVVEIVLFLKISTKIKWKDEKLYREFFSLYEAKKIKLIDETRF